MRDKFSHFRPLIYFLGLAFAVPAAYVVLKALGDAFSLLPPHTGLILVVVIAVLVTAGLLVAYIDEPNRKRFEDASKPLDRPKAIASPRHP